MSLRAGFLSGWRALPWSNLFDPERGKSLGAVVRFRLLEATVCALSVHEMIRWARVLARQPGIPRPTGVARWVDLTWLVDERWAQVNAGLAACLMALSLVGRLRVGYALAFVAFHLQYCARFGMGKTQHGTNSLGFVLLSLALAQLCFEKREERDQAAEGFTVILLSIGYSLAGLAKLVTTGVHWGQGRHLWHWIEARHLDVFAQTGTSPMPLLHEMVLSNEPMATALLTGGLLTELAACLLWWRPARRWLMLALVAMHVGIALVMNIAFVNNIVILLLLALPIAELVDWGAAKSRVGDGRTTPRAGL